MIVVATLQAATLTYMSVPAIDVVWEIYFQFVELTIAVIVVSVTAFQIFFVQQASHSSQGSSSWRPSWCKNQKFKKIWDKIWPSTSTEGLKYKKVWNKLWPSSSTEESNAPWLDPQIPRAEMTGIRSIIDRAADSPWLNSGKRGIGQSHELREMQPPKQAHVEPARYTMSTIDLKKEYNDMQRELQKKLPPSKPLYLNALQMNTSTMEVGEPSSAQREMPISSLDSSFKTAKPKQFPSVSPTRDQRSKVGIPMERPQLQPAKPRIPPIPKTGVSPLGPDSDGINFSETSRPFGEPSKQQPPPSESKSASGPVNAQSHHPLSAHPIPSPLFWDDRPLPPTPAANPAVRIEYFLRSPKSSENFPRQRSVGTRESEPSTARRPPRRSEEELLLRESGLQRAIKTSFEMASDPRPRVEESWFSDQG
ncbi:hypothetical protein MMC14_006401 [Varicellaria rhodocarpa]|nr:hypothetical protein [Varicellaria rhodocarpa]